MTTAEKFSRVEQVNFVRKKNGTAIYLVGSWRYDLLRKILVPKRIGAECITLIITSNCGIPAPVKEEATDSCRFVDLTTYPPENLVILPKRKLCAFNGVLSNIRKYYINIHADFSPFMKDKNLYVDIYGKTYFPDGNKETGFQEFSTPTIAASKNNSILRGDVSFQDHEERAKYEKWKINVYNSRPLSCKDIDEAAEHIRRENASSHMLNVVDIHLSRFVLNRKLLLLL